MSTDLRKEFKEFKEFEEFEEGRMGEWAYLWWSVASLARPSGREGERFFRARARMAETAYPPVERCLACEAEGGRKGKWANGQAFWR